MELEKQAKRAERQQQAEWQQQADMEKQAAASFWKKAFRKKRTRRKLGPAVPFQPAERKQEIGRASCRERVF